MQVSLRKSVAAVAAVTALAVGLSTANISPVAADEPTEVPSVSTVRFSDKWRYLCNTIWRSAGTDRPSLRNASMAHMASRPLSGVELRPTLPATHRTF